MESALKLFGIDILDCEYIDISEESVQYSNITFFIDSLKKYDGLSVEVFHDWKLRFWNNDTMEIVDEFFLIENEEFKRLLYSKYPIK